MEKKRLNKTFASTETSSGEAHRPNKLGNTRHGAWNQLCCIWFGGFTPQASTAAWPWCDLARTVEDQQAQLKASQNRDLLPGTRNRDQGGHSSFRAWPDSRLEDQPHTGCRAWGWTHLLRSERCLPTARPTPHEAKQSLFAPASTLP